MRKFQTVLLTKYVELETPDFNQILSRTCSIKVVLWVPLGNALFLSYSGANMTKMTDFCTFYEVKLSAKVEKMRDL